MNIRTPLAAALLMAASTAAAQFTLTDMYGGTPAASNPFSLANTAGLGAVDDIVFKCSRVIPYRKCEDAELKQREAILASGTCPRPASAACVDYLMAQGEAAPIQLLGNQSNPSTANDDFFKKCGTVPYRLCTPAEEKDKAAWEDGKKENKPGEKPEVNDAIQGPPQMMDMPEGGPEGKMLQYPSGRVEYCFDNSCSKTSGTPMTPKEAAAYLKDQYADQKQLANSINSGGPSLTNAGNSNSGMGINSLDDRNPPPGDNRKTTPPPNPGGTTPSPSGNSTTNNPSSNSSTDDNGGGVAATGDNSPRGLGADIGGDLGRLSGDTGGSSASGGGIASTSGGADFVKVDGRVAAAEALGSTGYSYKLMGAAEDTSKKIFKDGESAFNTEPDKNRRDVDTTYGDGKGVGKMKFDPNK